MSIVRGFAAGTITTLVALACLDKLTWAYAIITAVCWSLAWLSTEGVVWLCTHRIRVEPREP